MYVNVRLPQGFLNKPYKISPPKKAQVTPVFLVSADVVLFFRAFFLETWRILSSKSWECRHYRQMRRGAKVLDGSEIPNDHLTCLKPCKLWDKLPTSTGDRRIFSINCFSAWGMGWILEKHSIPDTQCMVYLLTNLPTKSIKQIKVPVRTFKQK